MLEEDQAEYMRILAAHGRRVANRWAAAALLNEKRRGLGEISDFFAQYGSESELPKRERSKSEMIHTFDPARMFNRYERGPEITAAAIESGASEVGHFARWPSPDSPEGAAFAAKLRTIREDAEEDDV